MASHAISGPLSLLALSPGPLDPVKVKVMVKVKVGRNTNGWCSEPFGHVAPPTLQNV